MAPMYFEKTEIASYTDVSALLCVAGEGGSADLFWKYQLYGNLCWERENHVLYHCGKYDHFSYKEFENEDRIALIKLPQDTSNAEIKKYMDQGYYALFPINTKLLGHTELPFKHNVFVTGYEAGSFIVYDYWAPYFTWKYIKVEENRLFESIDFTNPETVQEFYVFKLNEKRIPDNGFEADLGRLKELYTVMWKDNDCYDREKNVYGIDAYKAMGDYVASLERFGVTDFQNFHVLYDHLNFHYFCLNHLFGGTVLGQAVILPYRDLAGRAYKLRLFVYKYHMTRKSIEKVREFLLGELDYLRAGETMLIRRLTDAVD